MSWVGAIGGGALVVGVAFLLGRGMAVLQRQVDRSGSIRSGALWLKMLAPGVGLVLGFALSYRFEVGSGVAAATGAGPLAGALASGLYVSLVAVGTVAGYILGIRPLRRRALEESIRVPSGIYRRYRLVGILVVTLAGVLFELHRVPDWPLPPLATVTIVLYAWLGFYLQLTVPARLKAGGQSPFQCRTPTDDERRRIEACYERFGRSPGRILVGPESGNPAVLVAGNGPEHTLAITAPFLERVDDETLAVALAQADERGRRRYFWCVAGSITSITVVVLGISYTLSGLVPTTASIAGLWVGTFLLTWVPMWGMKRTTLAADRFAVEQLGADTVATAYRNAGQELTTVGQDLDGSSVVERLVDIGPFEPPMWVRIRWIEAARYG